VACRGRQGLLFLFTGSTLEALPPSTCPLLRPVTRSLLRRGVRKRPGRDLYPVHRSPVLGHAVPAEDMPPSSRIRAARLLSRASKLANRARHGQFSTARAHGGPSLGRTSDTLFGTAYPGALSWPTVGADRLLILGPVSRSGAGLPERKSEARKPRQRSPNPHCRSASSATYRHEGH
jgi:hypothetical protein